MTTWYIFIFNFSGFEQLVTALFFSAIFSLLETPQCMAKPLLEKLRYLRGEVADLMRELDLAETVIKSDLENQKDEENVHLATKDSKLYGSLLHVRNQRSVHHSDARIHSKVRSLVGMANEVETKADVSFSLYVST